VELLSEQDLHGLELMVGVDLKNNVDFAQSFDFNCNWSRRYSAAKRHNFI